MARTSGQAAMTADELLVRPDDDQRHELLSGCLLSEPPAGYRHGRVAGRIYSLLSDHVRAGGLGEVVPTDVGFILARSPDTVRSPDVAFVTKEKLQMIGEVKDYFPGAPDLAVEVLSPSERTGTIHGKVADYLAAGTRMVWVVDPEAQSIAVYRTLLAPRVVSGDQEVEGEDVVPGFALRVSEVFAS